jgi:ubiquinone/menaquinone biosynthesis C-methylase UbiE
LERKNYEKEAKIVKDIIKKLGSKKSGTLLDVGCGTGHIIQELATDRKRSELVGLDVSKAMLKVAKGNCSRLDNVGLVLADGLKLPFPDQALDIIITRLAEYSPGEAYRVLIEGGCFFKYGLGPQADKEIFEFFPERIETENFFFPNNPRKWKKEVSEPIEKAGFVISDVQDFKENDYYESEEELMDVIEMVPLVKDFDRNKDRKLVKRLAEKYRKKRGIRITWHYYVLVAKRQ